ncbi:hypothetical protein [Celeribacter indicus]|uniref:Uncharacterized protein n=1 Tax=Celeribacter indicus TaxID=1208324 RepID=A0A0B5DWW3_9RHOB|nr:hypothetical protein [Celeribacter indicus]AJE45605.1 hypothetical protein P73_0890 [Celeribacter indicus]SDW84791.1 hypothetical protein SAMN05443573_10845 [Celeribacter indicus]
MIALTEFERLEATALWRPEGQTQRVEVIVSVGEATLTLSDLNGGALTHWSLPAVSRISPAGELPAIYSPAPDTDEQIEIEDDLMIDAITRIRRAIDRGGPRHGRLRAAMLGAVAAGLVALAVLWLPDALIRQAVTIVPAVTRAEVGAGLLARMKRLSGESCETAQGARALDRLRARLFTGGGGQIVVLRSGVAVSQHLPGRIVLLNRAVVEDHEDPDVTAGYVLAEIQRAAEEDPLERLLQEAGLFATLRLLTTGHISPEVLDAHAESLLTAPLATPDTDALISRFARTEVHSAPYAYARDITGQSTLALIEADGLRIETSRPVLSDGDWVALQGICGG